MMSLQIHQPAARHRVPPEYTPRLRLKPKARGAEYLDGAWWPRSDDLTAELPDLLAVLAVRLGLIWRVVYDRTGWLPAPAQMIVHDRTVDLDAYLFELHNTMYVYGSDAAMTVLRVIPSTADPDTAHAALTAAVTPQPC
ncbi:DUF5994 family protein [Nocardia thraciensis]